MLRGIIVILLLAPVLVYAVDGQTSVPIPDPPDLPPPIESGEAIEPDITIIRRGKKTLEEYRINGELYMVKIIPEVGPPYYLIDTDGDGNMDVRHSDLERGLRVPQWVIFSW